MKTVGLIGGLSWESTAQYYRILNQMILQRTEGKHAARLVLVSLDFGEIAPAMHRGDWGFVGDRLCEAARRIEGAGADFLLIASNTPHKLADRVESAVRIPLLHIVDPTASAIRSAKLSRIGLLGTAFTMEEPFFKERLASHGIEAIVPGEADRRRCHAIIFEELVRGEVTPAARADFSQIMGRLVEAGGQGIVLGCTEFMLLAKPEDAPAPLFDTTALHAAAAVDAALDEAAFARLSARD
jgi:aspartate racemase